MMTLVATILSVLFVAAGIYVMVRDFYNIGAALASGITASGVKADKKATSVELKHAYVTRCVEPDGKYRQVLFLCKCDKSHGGGKMSLIYLHKEYIIETGKGGREYGTVCNRAR